MRNFTKEQGDLYMENENLIKELAYINILEAILEEDIKNTEDNRGE